MIYICVEQRDSRYMMARLTVDGWYVHAYYIILVELAMNIRQSFHNIAVLVGAFNQEKALVVAFSVIAKTSPKVRCKL